MSSNNQQDIPSSVIFVPFAKFSNEEKFLRPLLTVLLNDIKTTHSNSNEKQILAEILLIDNRMDEKDNVGFDQFEKDFSIDKTEDGNYRVSAFPKKTGRISNSVPKPFQASSGVIRAKNYAIELFLASYQNPYLIFVDAAAFPSPNWLSTIISETTIALKDKKIGSAAGMVIDGDRLVCVGHCQDRGATLHFGWNAPKDFQPEGGWKSLIEKAKVFCPCLCACLYTRACLSEVSKMTEAQGKSPLDFSLQHYYGCPDLGFKAKIVGFDFLFVENAKCDRKGYISSKKDPERRKREIRNRIVQTKRYYDQTSAEKHISTWDKHLQKAIDEKREDPKIYESAKSEVDAVLQAGGKYRQIGQELEGEILKPWVKK